MGTKFWFALEAERSASEKRQKKSFRSDKHNLSVTIQNFIGYRLAEDYNTKLKSFAQSDHRSTNSIQYIIDNNNDAKEKYLESSTSMIKIKNIVLSYPKMNTRERGPSKDEMINKDRISEQNIMMISNNNEDVEIEQSLIEDDLNIIVVDDEALTSKSNIRILKKVADEKGININIIEAVDGIECIYIVYKYLSKGKKISCIVSDEMMSYMRGSYSVEILGRITRNINISTPFYLVTA